MAYFSFPGAKLTSILYVSVAVVPGPGVHTNTRSLRGKLGGIPALRPKARCSSTAFARIEIDASDEFEAKTNQQKIYYSHHAHQASAGAGDICAFLLALLALYW